MKNFKYLNPGNLKEATNWLGKDRTQVLPMAGGTDILGLIKDSIETPEKLVNLKSIPELNRVTYQSGKGLQIGALTTIAELSGNPEIKKHYPVLSQTAGEIASPQLRNIGTIGGNLCQRPRCWYFRGEFNCLRKGGDLCFAADGKNKFHCIIGGGPCYIVHPSDMAVVLLALEAKLTISSKGKNRDIPISDFFVLPEQNVERENILNPGEILVRINIPALKSNVSSGFLKFKERNIWDFAQVSVAGIIEKSGNNIKSGRIVLGGVAPVPWFEKNVSSRLSGVSPSERNISEIVKSALTDEESLAQNEYKVILARNLIKRLIGKIVE